MKKNTPLDYAEFMLSHSRTRCELHICANGVKEKLAAGYLKPFVGHLREAEAQVAKGNQVIRLEPPSNFLKKNKVTWFTKGTLERFVRFVSTPEVLERVKNIDDELSQLEHVRVALSKTPLQSEDSLYSMDATHPGVHQTKGSLPTKDKRSLMGMGDNGADGSKIELLKAMDVRLVALKEEQSDAFSRAMAAGFDSSNMADLLDFSEHFGAERLREACCQFIDLLRKRNITQGIAGVQSPSAADAASSDSDMSLESCTDLELAADTEEHDSVGVEGEWSKAVTNNALDFSGKVKMIEQKNILGSNSSARTRSRWGPPERLQITHVESEVQESEISSKKEESKHQLGNYNRQDDIRESVSGLTPFEACGEFQTTKNPKEQPKRLSSTERLVPSVSDFGVHRSQGMQQGEGNIREGMFLSRLHKMTQQVEARRSTEDLGVHFTSVERSGELLGSQLSGYGYSSSLNSSGNSPLSVVSDAVAVWQRKQEKKVVPGQSPQGNATVLEEAPKVSGNSVVESSVDHVAAKDGDLDRKVNQEKSGKLRTAVSESSEVKENQDEPSSTTARRLSVQAAISLFESKKDTVGEPPTRKLVRQDSQKAALQSGSPALRRWSGLVIANDGTDGRQGTFTEASDKRQEKVRVTENVAQKTKVFVKEESQNSTELSQSATEMSSIYAGQSAIQAVPVEALLLKQIPSAQKQQPFLGMSSKALWEVLPKHSNQELKKTFTSSPPSNLKTNAVLSSKPLAEVTSRSATIAETENKDIIESPSCKDMVNKQVDLEVQPTQEVKEPKMPGSLSKHETALKRFPSSKEDKVSGKTAVNLKVDSFKHKASKNILAESNLQSRNISEPDKEPSLILHETPVDLYMQALVMIIDNHHQSAPSLSEEESFKEQKGRFYERYRQLRNARQKGENPAKRAEREAKLKFMNEILERRKDEMEAGGFRKVRNSPLVKEQEGVTQHVNFTKGEMGEDEVSAQQGGPVLASSHAQPKPKVQLAKKAIPKLQKSASASRSLLTTPPVSSPRTMPKNQSGAVASVSNQSKLANSSCNIHVDSPTYRNRQVDTTVDASNSTSVCNESSGRSHRKIYGHSTDVLSRTAETYVSCQPLDTSKDRSFSSKEGALCGEVQQLITMEASNGNVEFDPDIFADYESLSVAQNVKPFLRHGHDNFLTPGTGLTKHEVFEQMYSPASFDGQDGVGDGSKFISFENEFRTRDVNCSSLMFVEKSRSSAQKPLFPIQKPQEILNGEFAVLKVEDALNNDQVDQKNTKSNLQKDQMLLRLQDYEKGSPLISAKDSMGLSQRNSICSPTEPQECTAATYSDAAASPVNSLGETSGTLPGIYSSKAVMSPYSPSGSPASWAYSKAKHPLEHERHFNVTQSSKEPARGFKRLLHFGRKNRTTEFTTFDVVSVSTASEGDDEGKESMKQSPNEFVQRSDKGQHVSNSKDYSGFQDQGETYQLPSNISIPPSNFKLRDGHILRGSSLKASRSFFSLSSFRSRGGEGKSR